MTRLLRWYGSLFARIDYLSVVAYGAVGSFMGMFAYFAWERDLTNLHWAALLGFLLGTVPPTLEDSIFSRNFRRIPVWLYVVVRGFFYAGKALGGLIIFEIVALLIRGEPLDRLGVWLSSADLWFYYFCTMIFYDFAILFNQASRVIGKRKMVKLYFGSYLKPKVEDRVFLFVDLVDSTGVAERLPREDYFDFLNDFFHLMDKPARMRRAEIYQYVGDEAVFTWKAAAGLKNARCLRLFFDLERAVAKRADRFRDRYGVVPAFKAGLHVGEVVTAEIGGEKRDLVYNGDVLNVSSRLEKLCADFGERLLVSGAIVERVDTPEEIELTPLGAVVVRGKKAPMEVCAARLADAPDRIEARPTAKVG